MPLATSTLNASDADLELTFVSGLDDDIGEDSDVKEYAGFILSINEHHINFSLLLKQIGYKRSSATLISGILRRIRICSRNNLTLWKNILDMISDIMLKISTSWN